MKKIGRFVVCGLLGKGGMGAVYLARPALIETPVAVKVLSPSPFLKSLMPEKRLAELFLAEAKIMGRIRHPHVLSVWDLDFHEGRPFFVMPYYARSLGELMGETYEAEAPSRALPPGRALRHARQVLLGLSCLHDFGVIHRDIKPWNILLADDDSVKIADFGLSRLRNETFARPQNLKVGSPFYAAPEQEADPDRASAASDLYSVAVMLYRMVTGSFPESEKTDGLELGQAWRDFFGAGLAKRPEKRFPSARAMIQALDHLTRAWMEEREAACRLVLPETRPPEARPPAGRPRSAPVKIAASLAREFFGLDSLWRPVNPPESPGRFLDTGGGAVLDSATGLLWQKEGSDYPVTFSQALSYAAAKNRKAPSGQPPWRVPTVDELSGLAVSSEADRCLPPVFSTLQSRLWSADQATFTANWCLSPELGYVFRQDRAAPLFVRLVREG